MDFKVAIIGSGNLSHHISKHLNLNPDISISGIYSRNQISASSLAKSLNVSVFKSVNEIPKNTQMVFLWVNDDSISKVSSKLKGTLSPDTVIVHSSGTISLSAIDHYFENKACIWPLQTFSLNDEQLSLQEVPFFVCTSEDTTQQMLFKILNQFSAKVYKVDPESKLKLHLAAVFANNFVNHLIGIAIDMVKDSGQEVETLFPIIEKTVKNALSMGARTAQTGPAKRKDFETMESHLKIMESKSLKNLYMTISESIIRNQSK